MARQALRGVLRPRLGEPAGNALAAPNFEMRMSESRQDHRRFRLMDGGASPGGAGASSSNFGGVFSSDEDMDEDGRGSMDRGWASFGCFSDASGLNTPRTSFRGSFGRSPRGNSFQRTSCGAHGNADRGERLSNEMRGERLDSFNNGRVSWGSSWKQHAAPHVAAVDSADDLSDMPRASNKSTRSTKSTKSTWKPEASTSEKEKKEGKDNGERDSNSSRMSFRSLRKLRPTLSLRSNKASETQRAAAEASGDRVSFSSKKGRSSDPLADCAEDLLTEGRMLMDGNAGDADEELWMSGRSRRCGSKGNSASGDFLFEDGPREEVQHTSSDKSRSGHRAVSNTSSSSRSSEIKRRTRPTIGDSFRSVTPSTKYPPSSPFQDDFVGDKDSNGSDDLESQSFKMRSAPRANRTECRSKSLNSGAKSVLPTPQPHNAARAAAVSAASACAEACAGSGALVSPSPSLASRPTAAESGERGSEPRMSSRSLRGRLGSLVASRMGSLAR